MSEDAATTKSTVGQQEPTTALIESVKTLNVDQNCADHDNDDPTCSSTAVEDDGGEGLVVETKVQETSTNTNTTFHQQVQHVKAKVSTSTNKGGRVSARAQWLTNQAFHKDCHDDKTSSPTTHTNHTTTTPMRRGKVGAKMKWLESAFSKENDGKNMADNQDDEVVVQSSPSTVLNKGAATASRTTTTTSMGTAAVQIRTTPRSSSNSPAKYLDKRNDSMTWAYEVWYKKGMLTWRPTCLQNQVSTE